MFNRYRELGLALIPLRPGTKRPLEENWSRYCDRLPTEEETDAWEAQGHQAFGLAMGPSSGLLAIDIDSDDAKVLQAVKPSPVRKRGRQGETRFFRFNPDVPSTKVAGCIDVLSYGRQTVMPPTVHPDTRQPYVWLTPDTLESVSLAELPEFTVDDLNDLRRALEPERYEAGEAAGAELTGGPWTNTDPTRRCPHGSHDRLKRIANALISRGASPDEAVRELLRYDQENHLPTGYFSDATRSDCFADPASNALFFYASNLRTYNRRQVRQGQQSIVPLISGTEILEVGPAPEAKPFAAVEWPEPKGLVRDIRDLILGLSMREQRGLAMGGAIAIASALIANRLRLEDTWPNVYVLNIAPTGAGKSFPYSAAKRLLLPEHGLPLIGAGGYRSSSAMLADLVGRRERLDLIDECSGLFRMIRDGGIFQTDMVDVLNGLWSDSSTQFLTPESVKAGKDKDRMAVWHPCISTLFSTTPEGLKQSVSAYFLSQGFIARCLIFCDAEYGQTKRSRWDEELAISIIDRARELQALPNDMPGDLKRNYMSPKPYPRPIDADQDALEMLESLRARCDERIESPDTSETERQFLTRFHQQVCKLALIHASGSTRRVTPEDVTWASATLEASRHNAIPLLGQMGAENLQEASVLRVLETIRKAGQITQSKLIGKTRFLRTSERSEILASLTSEGRIRATRTDTGTTLYAFIQ